VALSYVLSGEKQSMDVTDAQWEIRAGYIRVPLTFEPSAR
jgi:hypothetical protein